MVNLASTSTLSEPVVLGEVSETLMIPLWCRAIESERRRGLLHDPKAQAMVAALDYDFDRRFADLRRLAFRACLRTVMIDRWVQRFIRARRHATVVEIGTGLNTRFERVDDGALRWFDVDLPDSMALRRRFFTDTSRRTMIEGAFGDEDWLARIEPAEGPKLFIVEAVLVYLDEAVVRRGFEQIARAFPGSEIIFDTVTTRAVSSRNRPMMKSYQAPFVWGCDDPRVIEGWAQHRLRETTTIDELPRELRRRVPLEHRLMLPYLRWRKPELLRSHALNRVELHPPMTDDR
ncbi:class I SAM-dependent methyltransferase [Enhygromyxa salina]|nr:class I SAM-dependent methyltransferase [Enhygromyxa salina]